MKIFGLEISRQKAGPPAALSSVGNRGGWFPLVREPGTGAWQRNEEVEWQDITSFGAVFACVSLIMNDIGKMGMPALLQQAAAIWEPVDNSAYSPVLRKPNPFQTAIKFIEQWIASKLLYGNAYILKVRDENRVVRRLYPLDPRRVQVLVSPSGSVYYSLGDDNLTPEALQGKTVPASEIIHDVMCALFHPLCGISPIYACGLAAAQGLRIQQHSAKFFRNGAQPGGVITAPDTISDVTAKRLQDHWEREFAGDNSGKVAVLGDGMKYEPMTMRAIDAQLMEQLNWTGLTVCSCFHVPPYMVGIGPMPSWNNIEALNQQYYSQCLQSLMESLEACLDEGLGLPSNLMVQFDLDKLLRMDTATLIKSEAEAVKAGIKAPNEARRRLNLKATAGGDEPYLQQQNFSLGALHRRDESEGAPSSKKKRSAAPAPTAADEESLEDETTKELAGRLLRKAWEMAA